MTTSAADVEATANDAESEDFDGEKKFQDVLLEIKKKYLDPDVKDNKKYVSREACKCLFQHVHGLSPGERSPGRQ